MPLKKGYIDKLKIWGVGWGYSGNGNGWKMPLDIFYVKLLISL